MNRNKFLTLLLPAALLFGACSQTGSNPTADAANNDPTTAGSVELKQVTSAIFDLPSSMAASDPQVQITAQTGTTSLAKVAAADTFSSAETIGLDAYKLIPVYVSIAEAVKDSVRSLITNLSSQELPSTFDGMWGDYQVKLVTKDSLFADESGLAVHLVMKKNDSTVLRLNYVRNARSQFRGSCYFKSELKDSTSFLLRFSNVNEGVLGKRMTLWITKPESTLDDSDAPSVLRIHAKETPAGRMLVSGFSYHPHHTGDDFWATGAKIYGFRALSNIEKNQTILRVAFADADKADKDFFTNYSLDQAVATQAAVVFKAKLSTDTLLAKVVLYSLAHNLTLEQVFTSHFVVATTGTSERSIDSFSASDIDSFLTLNADYIKAGTDDGMKMLLFLVKVKQPIYLSANASIVGYQGMIPALFSLQSAQIDTESFDAEIPASASTEVITESAADADPTDL